MNIRSSFEAGGPSSHHHESLKIRTGARAGGVEANANASLRG